jgi:aldose 1-epimerase
MYMSEDGEEGFPGTLKAVAHYEWGEDNSLKLTLTAQTDKDTVVNLTNHAYFNLNGEGNGTIEDHILRLNCSEYLPTDAGLIPLGEPAPVAGTPLDFVNAKKVGRDLRKDCPALAVAKGYDHCFVIDGYMPGQLQTAAELYSEKSGIALEVITTQPGLQVYSGNWLGGAKGKNGHVYPDYSGIALECQHFPDSPNEPEYPSTVLKPGETYQEAIIFAFSVK